MGVRWTRSWAGRLAAVGVAGAASLSTVPAGAGAVAPALVAVVVDGTTSAATATAVRDVGGEVDAPLEVIGGVAGRVPAGSIADLRAEGLVVVPDAELAPVGHDFATAEGDGGAAPAGPSDPSAPGTGAGVGVALIDTGVDDSLAPLEGHVVHGRSFGRGDGDGYGHGTFMAGLIASAAPGTEIVSIKVADDDGTTSLGTLIQAIGWAVVHQDDATTPFEVLNLSFGTVAPMGAAADPLVQAVEAAWASGLTVVVAAGNEGHGTVTSPGTSPSAITVGATDATGEAVAEWSGRLRNESKPEVVAPGTSLVSLRVPGSVIDVQNPGARVGETGFRGSGTSMAAALTSAAAAVVLEAHPGAEPVDVKGALVDTATPIDGGRRIDVTAATDQTPSDGEEPDRGRGKARGRPSPTPGWEGSRWTGSRWTGSRWTGSRWTGSRWTGSRWTEASWAEATWSGSRWTGSRWTGSRWTEDEWAGSRWTGSRWTGSRWTLVDETS